MHLSVMSLMYNKARELEGDTQYLTECAWCTRKYVHVEQLG